MKLVLRHFMYNLNDENILNLARRNSINKVANGVAKIYLITFGTLCLF